MYYISFAYADKIYGGVSEADGLNEGGYGDLKAAEEAADHILENCSGVNPDLIRIFETEHETPVWGDLCEAYRWTDEDDWEYTVAEFDYNGADTMRWEEDDTYDE